MEQFTPQAVYGLYNLLSNDDKITFLQLVGSNCTADAPFLMVGKLPVPERARFAELVAGTLNDLGFFAFIQREAVKVVSEKLAGQVSEAAIRELEQALDIHLRAAMPTYDAGVVEVAEAERKKKQYPANKVRDRRHAIRALLASHPDMTPTRILAFLLEHHNEIATTNARPVSLKTIRNDLAEIKKRGPSGKGRAS